jgi:membrane-bound lytic murein transglycosylase B
MKNNLTRRLFIRSSVLGGGAALVASSRPFDAYAEGDDFAAFLQGLKPAAAAQGVTADAFDAAIIGLKPDAGVIAQSRKQSEFTRPFWDYVEGAVSGARLKQGAAAIGRSGAALDAVSRSLGVNRSTVAGIWGMESNFGSSMGDKDVLRSTASLAFARYRGDFYAKEFVAALRVLSEGHIGRAGMIGSWAGGMGQTQFIPTSFLKYAYDADGDGRKNIWTSAPDALGSAANHLKIDGWVAGLPWGFEAVVPKDFDFAYGDRMQRHAFGILTQQGIARPGGKPLPKNGSGGLFLPAGVRGPAFIITDNFEVIRKYNISDAYAVGVGLLGDRLYGGAPLAARWPRDEPQLGTKELAEVQRRLKALGLPISKIDGKLGWQTRQGVQAVQRQRGDIPDGHPTPAFLKALRSS